MKTTNLRIPQALNRLLCGLADTLVYEEGENTHYVLSGDTFYQYTKDLNKESFILPVTDAERVFSGREVWSVKTTGIKPGGAREYFEAHP